MKNFKKIEEYFSNYLREQMYDVKPEVKERIIARILLEFSKIQQNQHQQFEDIVKKVDEDCNLYYENCNNSYTCQEILKELNKLK